MGPKLLRWIALLVALAFAGLPHSLHAQSVPIAAWQRADWWRNTATLDLDFYNDRYYLNGTTYSGVANFITGAGATFTRAAQNITSTGSPFYIGAGQAFVSRASSGTYFDNTGTLQTAATNVARDNHNPVSPYADLGTLIEPTATNGLTDNTMQGVAAYNTTELTTNGNFATSCTSTCTGWTSIVNGGTGTVVFNNNATLTGDGTHQAAIQQAITTVVGKTYNFSVTVSAGNPVLVQAGTTQGASNLLVSSTSNAGTTMNYIFTATTTTSWIQIGETNAVSAVITQVSVQNAGSLPTGWSAGSATSGLSLQVIGSGTENGISYVDLRWFGTIANTGAFPYLAFGPVCSMYAASQYAIVTTSAYMKLQAGSLSNINAPTITIHAKSSACVDPNTNASTGVYTMSSNALATQRWVVSTTSTTFSSATTAYASSSLTFTSGAAGNAIDATFRIGMPQMEAGSTATSVIATTNAAVTRAADVYSASGATYFDNTGTLQVAASNAPRIDHSSASPYATQGILIEEGRTNNVKNSVGSGAIAGSPGTLPTSWYLSTCSSCSVVGSGVENGINYVDLNIVNNANMDINFTTGAFAALQNQSWTVSSYIKLVGGSFTNAALGFRTFTEDNTGTAINGYTSVISPAPTGAALSSQRSYYALSLPDAATAYTFSRLVVTNVTGSYNFTIRIGMPQFELGSFPTSVIPTTGNTVTRAADLFSVPTSAGGTWSNGTTGTLIAVAQPYVQKTVTGNSSGIAALTDGTANNGINMYFGNTPTYDPADLRYELFSSGTNSAGGCSSSTFTLGALMSEAVAFQSGAQNGAIDATSCSAGSLTLATLTSLYIGNNRTLSSSNALDGWVNRITYFPTVQPNPSLLDYTR